MNKFLLFLLGMTTLLGCDFFNKKKTTEANDLDKVVLTTVADQIRIYSKAGLEGKEIARIDKNTPLFYLEKMSAFTTEITLNGITFNEPWLFVELPDQQKGWVYAGIVDFDNKGLGKSLYDDIIRKRLAHFFGENASNLIEIYSELYENTETAYEFSELYRVGLELRDSLIIELNQINLSETPEIPDLFWMDEPLPALIPTQVPEANMFHLFFDYKSLMQKAKATVGLEDEAFINVLYSMYHHDSIEYFYPSWYIYQSDFTNIYSLLGENIHYKLLVEMDSLSVESTLFKTFYNDIKIQLVQDITSNNQYWRSSEDILKELQMIIEADLPILNEADKIGLSARVKMFEQPQEFDVLVNMREGL